LLKKRLFETAAGSVIKYDLDKEQQKTQKSLGKLKQSIQTDEQGQQTIHNSRHANGIDNQYINADHCDRNKQTPQEQKTDIRESKRTGAASVTIQIHKYERTEAKVREDQVILSRNSEEIRNSSAGEKAAELIAGCQWTGLVLGGVFGGVLTGIIALLAGVPIMQTCVALNIADGALIGTVLGVTVGFGGVAIEKAVDSINSSLRDSDLP
jgi:hypothetical protein